MRVLLDTCTFLWLVAGDESLSDVTRKAFADPANQVLLSPASAWEITVKHGFGRLDLADPPEVFVPQQRKRHRIESLPIDELCVLHVAKLPNRHRDPFDRLLIAQVIVNGCLVATPDPLIRQYPVRVLWD